MAKRGEDRMDQRLRWMTENVEGAYNAVHPKGHDNAGEPCVNSGTCILVCCYINALGKVLWKKQKTGDRQRFQRFVNYCMSDFVKESSANGLPEGGVLVLYKAFRCGFVHGYPKKNFAWGRFGAGNYWYRDKTNRLVLNIDELVLGFKRGKEEFKQRAVADPELRTKFLQYITLD